MSEQTKKKCENNMFYSIWIEDRCSQRRAHTMPFNTHLSDFVLYIALLCRVCVCALSCSSRLFLCPSVFVSVSLVLRVLLLLLLFGFLLLPLLSAYGALLLFFFTCLLAYSFARSSVVLVCNIPAMWFCRNLERQKDNDNVVREREQRKTESLCWMS